MSKLITAFLFLLIGASILSAVMEGGGGIVTTRLNGPITDADTTITVDSTTDYLDADYIIIGDEKVLYTGTTATEFTGCSRGYDGTEAVAHADNAIVYTADSSAVNNALGFSVAATSDTMGMWAAITIPFYFLTKTIPRIVMMNYSFLSGNLAIIGWFFFAAAGGLVITFALYLAGGRRV